MVKKLITMTGEMEEEIEDYQFAERLPSFTESVRKLLAVGINAEHSRKQTGFSYGEGDKKRWER